MFETLIVQPIFNVLAIIYALVPGNDFGVAVVLFTILVRMALWPLLRKQLHQTRKIRALQPEIKKIKEKTKGDKQKEGQLLMELYKERGVNPFGTIGILFVQLPILFGLFQGLRQVSADPNTFLDLTYSWVQELGHVKEIVLDINQFDPVSLGIIDLTRAAFDSMGTYMPALALALLAGAFQYFQSKAMTPDTKDQRTIREILKDEANGKKADQSEINAAMGRNMRYFFPVLTFFFASRFASALALYWATGSLVGIIQQQSVLNKDVEEMEDTVAESSTAPKKSQPKSKAKTKKENDATSSKKRKKRKKK